MNYSNDRQFLLSLFGKTETDAISLISKNGMVSRIIERDGKSTSFTMDYNMDRVNLTIKNGKVVSACNDDKFFGSK